MIKTKRRRLLQAKARLLQIELHRMYPMIWLEERLGEDKRSYIWSEYEEYKNHDWDGDKDPLYAAWQTIANAYKQVNNKTLPTYKTVAIESCTGSGKTRMLARIVAWFLDCFENSLVVTSAPSQGQLDIGLWAEISMLYPKIKKIRPHAQKWKKRLAMDVRTMDVKDTEDVEILLENSWMATTHVAGVKASEESSNKARGYHRKYMLIILEECTGIPNSIITAFLNTCTGTTNFILAVGNPDNEFDALHQLAISKNTANFRISAFDHPNVVLQKELYAGAITQSSINTRTEDYGKDSSLWQAMVRGVSPTQGKDSLIALDWVEQCVNSQHEDTQDSNNSVGVDVANSAKGDKAATVWGQANNLLRADEFYCKNATHLAYNLLMDNVELGAAGYECYDIPTIADYEIMDDCIGVDAVGVGVATVNAFADRGLEVVALQGGSWKEAIPTEYKWQAGKRVEIPQYRFTSLRSQMYWQLREDLRLKKINILLDDKIMLKQLIKELCVAKVVASNSSISVEGKEDIKKRLSGKSPNVADGVVYWNWVRHGYRIARYGLAALSGG